MQDFRRCLPVSDVLDQNIARSRWLQAVRTVQVEVLKIRRKYEMLPDVCRIKGEAHPSAAAFHRMKLLGISTGPDAAEVLAQPAPRAPHLNSHPVGYCGSSCQQPPLRPQKGTEVTEVRSVGDSPGMRLIHGHREAAVAGDRDEAAQRVLPGNACRWMKHVPPHRGKQVGRQLRTPGPHPEVHARPFTHGGIELQHLDVCRAVPMLRHNHTLSIWQARLKVQISGNSSETHRQYGGIDCLRGPARSSAGPTQPLTGIHPTKKHDPCRCTNRDGHATGVLRVTDIDARRPEADFYAFAVLAAVAALEPSGPLRRHLLLFLTSRSAPRRSP